MKNSNQKISAIVVAALFLFTSCSRELSSIQHPNKLANVQTLEKANAPVKAPEPMALVKAPVPQIQPENKTIAPISAIGTKTKNLIHARKLNHNLVANMLPKKVAKAILKQANSVKPLASNNRIASYSKTSHTEGWIGLAITCLIVGLILLILGFGVLGSIFVDIGVIILVIALVFFILWLLAEAAES